MRDSRTLDIKRCTRVITLTLLVLFCFFCIIYAAVNCNESVAFDNEQTFPFSDNWVTISPDGAEMPITLPTNIEATAGKPYSVYKTIPKDMPKPAVLCFRSSHQVVRIFLEDKLIYEFGTNPNSQPFGRSPGSAWNLVRIPEGEADSRLQIELTAQYPVHAGWIDNVIVGSKAAILFKLAKDYAPSFLVCMLILLCGFAMLLVYFTIVKKHTKNRDVLLLGLFSLFVSFWMLGEIKLVQFFIGNQIAAFTLTVIALMVAPIPLIKFVGNLEDFRYKTVTIWLVRVLYITAAVVLALQLFNIVDFMDIMSPLTGFLFVITAISLILVLVDFLRNRNRNLRYVAISLLCLGVLTLIELVSWTYLGASNGGDFLRVGVLLFILIQAWIAVKKGIKIFRLSRVASLDALTGCQNRMAFTHRIAELKEYKKVGVVMADLNNLKHINDTYGHEVGDDSILRCAHHFEGAFSELGDCYRIGGDEFLFLGTDIRLETIEERIKVMQKLCVNEQETVSYPFAIAAGCAIFDPEIDEDISATIRRADALMYENKMKAKNALGQIQSDYFPSL